MKIINKQAFDLIERKVVIKNPIFKTLYGLEVEEGIEVEQQEWSVKKWQKPYTSVREFGLRHDMEFRVKKTDNGYAILRIK